MTCDFSIAIKKLEKEVEIITKKIPKLSKKRQKEDAKNRAKQAAEEERLNREKAIKEDKYEAQYKAVAKSLELEKVFSNYRYYQDKKSR